MFITSHHRAYWQKLLNDHPEELDENGTDISTIRQNLTLAPIDRVRQMRHYGRILEELFSHDRQRVAGCAITKRLKAAIDDYVIAAQEGDLEKSELAGWTIEMMVPDKYKRGGQPRQRAAIWTTSLRPADSMRPKEPR